MKPRNLGYGTSCMAWWAFNMITGALTEWADAFRRELKWDCGVAIVPTAKIGKCSHCQRTPLLLARTSSWRNNNFSVPTKQWFAHCSIMEEWMVLTLPSRPARRTNPVFNHFSSESVVQRSKRVLLGHFKERTPLLAGRTLSSMHGKRLLKKNIYPLYTRYILHSRGSHIIPTTNYQNQNNPLIRLTTSEHHRIPKGEDRLPTPIFQGGAVKPTVSTSTSKSKQVGGFKGFLFSSVFGEMIHFD